MFSNEIFKTPDGMIRDVTFIQNTFNFSNNLPNMMTEYVKLKALMSVTSKSLNLFGSNDELEYDGDDVKQIEGTVEYEIVDDDEIVINKSEFLLDLLEDPIHDGDDEEIHIPHVSIKRTSNWKKDIYNHNIFLNNTYGLVDLEVPNDKHHLILFLDNFEERDLNDDVEYVVKEIQHRIDKTETMFYIIFEPHYISDGEVLLTPKEKSGDLFIPDLISIHSVFSHKPRYFQVNPETYYRRYAQKIN